MPYGPAAPAGRARRRARDEQRRRRRRVLWIGVTMYAVFGGADFGAGFWSLLAGGGERGRRAARADRLGDRPGLGGQPRLADLRPRRALDRLLAGVRVDLLDAVHPAQPGRARHRAARRRASPSTRRRGGPGAGSSPSASSGSRRCSRRSSWARSSARSPRGRVPVGNATGDRRHQLAQSALARDRGAVRRHRPRTWRRCSSSATPAAPARPTSSATSPPARSTAAVVTGRARGRRPRRAAQRRALRLRRPHQRRAAARDRSRCSAGSPCSCCFAAAPAAAPAPLAVGAVAAVIWGWGVAQYPYLLPETLTIDDAAAPSATLTGVLIVFGVAVVLVLPSIGLLYTLVQREPGRGERGPAAALGGRVLGLVASQQLLLLLPPREHEEHEHRAEHDRDDARRCTPTGRP